MDAVEFYKAFKRMCYKTDCKDCLLDQKCRPSANVEPEEVVELVEEWSKDHHIKTRQSEFLKMFPNAQLGNGVVDICPMNFDRSFECSYKNDYYTCRKCKRDYWLTEVPDND